MSELPPELVLSILELIPSDDPLYRTTVLSITRVFPNLPANSLLFKRIVLERTEQVTQLTRRLVQSDWRNVVQYVQEFAWNGWTVDPQLIVNVLAKLPQLRSLELWIGVHFTPEHLTDIFRSPRAGLKNLSLRFRPYVEKANYLPFLKGSFFDSTLYCLASWPHTSLPTLSIIQDSLPEATPTTGPTPPKKFAQPIVFHTLDATLPPFSASAFLSSTTALRLRLPARPVASPLTRPPHALPSLRLIDLSTCTVFGAELTDTLLARLPSLAHVILDSDTSTSTSSEHTHGGLIRGEYHADDWAVLGKGCALAGLLSLLPPHSQRQLDSPAQPKPAVKDSAQQRSPSGPPHRATTKHPAEFPTTSTKSPLLLARVRIWPAAPRLRTLATTLPSAISASKHAEIRDNFARGWAEGISQLMQTRARLYQSYRLGSISVMRFADEEPLERDEDDEENEGESANGLEGLTEVTEWDENIEQISAPVLCFAGPDRDAVHEEGCAHSEAWKVWRD
ncbi:F-box domain-containing protein [Mycena chlorophos]|uniref:F-box domain-containing protein n=1 Tax=Mycena chlorophos TaxID=658473 RepID=A0A8H6W227_MYCCL|nr:F-box domain-containing protein [Mycena chlorophos]